MAVISNPVVDLALELAKDYKRNLTLNDFLITIGMYYTEEEIKELLKNGVVCGYEKYLMKQAMKDAKELLE